MMLPHIDDPSEYSSMVYNHKYYRAAEISTRQDRGALYLLCHVARIADHCNVGKVTIEMLPEEILLEIFAFYMDGDHDHEEWETLVHVCRGWRSIVFAAPRHLNLQLACTGRTPVRTMLDIWPAFPIFIRVNGSVDVINDNVSAALEKHDRICTVDAYNVSDAVLKELVEAMQVTFPALTDLDLHSYEDAILPGSFLDGSAPNLRSLRLMNLAFAALPKLLLSSPGLVSLSLCWIPDSWYISSDTMVNCLSSLTRLEHLEISFQTSQPFPGFPNRASRRPPPPTRTAFPVLSTLRLRGVTEYLDQILSHMEAPLLDHVDIIFLDPPIFDISRIALCIGRMGTFETFDQAYMLFRRHDRFDVVLSSRKGTTSGKMLTLSLLWNDSGWVLEALTWDTCDHLFEPFDLCDPKGILLPSWSKNMDNAPWLHFVRLCTAVEDMYMTQGLAVCVAPVLQGLTGERVTEVLPVLRTIFVERLDSLGPVQEALGQFVAARQLLSGHPVDVQCWVMGVMGERTDRSGHR